MAGPPSSRYNRRAAIEDIEAIDRLRRRRSSSRLPGFYGADAVPWDLSKVGGQRDGLVEDNVVQEIDNGRTLAAAGPHTRGNGGGMKPRQTGVG